MLRAASNEMQRTNLNAAEVNIRTMWGKVALLENLKNYKSASTYYAYNNKIIIIIIIIII